MKTLRDQAGVAMVTVLFVGAALTVVASSATFLTITEFRSNTSDRQGSSALAYAEGGLDRLLLKIRTLRYGDFREAGCSDGVYTGANPETVEGAIGDGFYNASFTVFPFTDTRCSDARNDASPRNVKTYAITATGCLRRANVGGVLQCQVGSPDAGATRLIRQVLKIRSLNLPIGLYANSVTAAGQPNQATNISLISTGDVTGRDKFGFTGDDPYYVKSDFYPERYGAAPKLADASVPAAAHATGILYCRNCPGGSSKDEHETLNPNCTANSSVGTPQRSIWDGSRSGRAYTGTETTKNCPGYIGDHPFRSSFTADDLQNVAPTPELSEEDYLLFKQEAQSNGLYCTHSLAGGNQQRSCTRLGVNIPNPTTKIEDGAPYNISTMPDHFVAYIEYPQGLPKSSANNVQWNANVRGCDDDLGSSDPDDAERSVLVIVRNGSLDMNATNLYVTGAFLAPVGIFKATGGVTVHGTVIADEIVLGGGTKFVNSECWVSNIFSFHNVAADRWNEIDRP